MGYIIEAAEGGVEDCVPIFIGHKDHQVVPTDSGVIHQDLDVGFGIRLLPGFECRADFRPIRNIERHQGPVLSGFTDQGQGLLGFFPVMGIIYQDMVAHLRQFFTDGAADSSASAGY